MAAVEAGTATAGAVFGGSTDGATDGPVASAAGGVTERARASYGNHP